MKSLLTLSGRIGLILLTALFIIGITISVVNTDSTATFPVDRSSTVSSQVDADSLTPSDDTAAPSGEFRDEFHGPTDQSVTTQLAFGLVGLLKNVVIIGVIVLVVQWSERRFTAQSARLAG